MQGCNVRGLGNFVEHVNDVAEVHIHSSYELMNLILSSTNLQDYVYILYVCRTNSTSRFEQN